MLYYIEILFSIRNYVKKNSNIIRELYLKNLRQRSQHLVMFVFVASLSLTMLYIVLQLLVKGKRDSLRFEVYD